MFFHPSIARLVRTRGRLVALGALLGMSLACIPESIQLSIQEPPPCCFGRNQAIELIILDSSTQLHLSDVSVTGTDGGGHPAQAYTLERGDEGYRDYHLDGPSGTWTLSISKSGYQTQSLSVEVPQHSDGSCSFNEVQRLTVSLVADSN